MNTINPSHPIVVGVESKQQASLRFALEEATRQHCSVRIVHAYAIAASGVGVFYGSDLIDAAEEDAQEVLAGARAFVESLDTDVAVEYSAQIGAPTPVLEAESLAARAIILGPDDNAWYDRILVGEVGSSLVRQARCPVIVVPENWNAEESRRGGVVVTIDGVTGAEGPLRFAFAAASRRGEELHVMHVVPSATSIADEEQERLAVAEVLAGWSAEFPEVTVHRSIVFGELDEVCSSATKLANLVVVGTPHREAWTLAFSKPVAVSIIKEAGCPVAVVPSDFDWRPGR